MVRCEILNSNNYYIPDQSLLFDLNPRVFPLLQQTIQKRFQDLKRLANLPKPKQTLSQSKQRSPTDIPQHFIDFALLEQNAVHSGEQVTTEIFYQLGVYQTEECLHDAQGVLVSGFLGAEETEDVD